MTLYPHLQNHLFGLSGFALPGEKFIEIIRTFCGVPVVPKYRDTGHNDWAKGAPDGSFQVCAFFVIDMGTASICSWVRPKLPFN